VHVATRQSLQVLIGINQSKQFARYSEANKFVHAVIFICAQFLCAWSSGSIKYVWKLSFVFA